MQNAKLVGNRPGQAAFGAAAAAVLLVAAVLLLVVRLPAEAQANDRDVGGVTLTSPNPGELVIAWDAPSRAPNDYRVTWKKSDGKWHSYKHANTVDGGNAFPTGTSHTVTALEEGTAYQARVRARYFNDNGDLEKSGPWSDAVEITISATPSQDGEGDSDQGPSTSPPAKPTGLITAASHNSVLLSWDNPGGDTVTGYQVLRGEDADNLAVLTDDTGSTSASYTDSTVEAQTTYVYAVRGRNARGLGPQSDPVTVTTSAAPEEDDPPTSARAVAGVDIAIHGQELDTSGTCNEDTIGNVTDACTINIDTPTVTLAVDGTVDSDDRLNVKIGRDKAAVDAASVSADQDDLRGANQEVSLTFQVGRNLLRVWADEDETTGGSEEHFYRVNVLPYWELNGDRLSKSDDCRAATNRNTAQITDDDCIVTQFGNTATIRFHNVIKDQFNVYVHVNGNQVISEPDNTELAAPFTLDLQDGDNVVRVRLASKRDSHFSENYGNDKFHYKVETGVLVSNLGQVSSGSGLENPLANQFTTGSNPSGYIISKVGLKIAGDSQTVPRVSIYSDNSGQPGSSLKVLTNPGTIPPGPAPEDVIDFGADNYRLEPGTPYWIVVEKASGSEPMYLGRTTLTAEDTGSAAGWSIGDNGARLVGGTWNTLTAIYGLAVKGTVAPAVSDAATLSALALTDASNNAVALDPAFASATTSYNATVANSVSRIKVEPTANDSNADIEYLDDSDATLPDEDTNTAVFDFDLSVGQNVVKVKVTAEDGTTTETYEVFIRRAATDNLVSNLGQFSFGFISIDTTGSDKATQFTTGSETDGYLISQVRLNISADSGTIPRVSIYSDSSGQPGSSLKVLTNPGAIPTTATEVDFGADNYKLEPSTSYWIVVERASGSGSIGVGTTGSAAEDPGTALGWSIGDNGSFQIAVKGTVAPPAVSDDAALKSLELNDASFNAIALSPAFASDTTSYNATVANSFARIKVRPIPNDPSADTEYLNESGSTLADADPDSVFFDFNLDVGPNVVKVKVTAEDSTTTETYTITVTRQAAATTASTDATLSALALFDFNSDAVTLSPAFAAAVTSYTAAVANAHTDGKLEATPNDSNATVEFLDENDATITTASQTGNVHSILPDFEVGENVFKVKVTAGDGTTSRTYTITVTRVDFLVSNLGQTEGGTHGVRSAGAGTAVQFMTGSHALGYNISKVRLRLGSPAGIEPRVSIYSDDSGLRPGSTLKVLINPIVIPTSRSVIEFDAEDYALDADTTYWVAVERGPGTGDINVSYTNSTDEDPGSAAGWSTGDFHALRSGGVWVSTNLPPLQVAILGTADTTPNNPPTGKPTILGTPESGQTLTPSTANIRDADGISNPRYVYSWIRVDGGTEALVQSSSSPNYLLTDDDVGKKIKVAVRYFDDGGRNERVESNLYPASGNIRNKPNSPPTGSPTIAGKAEVGHTLTAVTSAIADPDGLTNPGFTYQWQRQDGGVFTDITGATGMLYRLGTGDEGKRVRVKVTFTDDDGNRHSLTGAPTGEVQAQASIPSDKVEVSLGQTAYTVDEGDTLQVTVTLAEAHDEDGRVIIPFTLTPADGATKADFRVKSSYFRLVRFYAGETTEQIEITAVDDTLDDDGENLALCLGELPEPYAVLPGRDCSTINIVDNDDPNSVEIYFHNANYNAHEDGSPVTVLVAMDPVPDREITIPITFTRNGGLSAADHSPVTTSVTFGPEVHRYHNIPAYREIEIWAIDDSEDDDGEYMDITFGNVSDPYVSERTGTNPCCSQIPGTVRPYSETRVWFEDNEFTQVPVSNPREDKFDDSLSMIVTFSADTYDAHEGGGAATVSVWLLRHFDREREVTIPINVERMGGATRADTISTYTSIPSTITFKPGQTAQTFRVAALDDSVDDDGEWLKLSFGKLPERVSEGVESTCHYGACAHNTARVNLLDNDVPEVQVSFAQSDYKAATSREKCCVYAQLDVTVNLSAAPERFVDVGIVAESIRGDGDIYFAYAAYIPRRPHRGATFDADETEFTVTVVMSALGEEFDANQTYRLRFDGMSDRVSVGSSATATITVSGSP